MKCFSMYNERIYNLLIIRRASILGMNLKVSFIPKTISDDLTIANFCILPWEMERK